jgi:DNA-3-methyladenine glycosylase II
MIISHFTLPVLPPFRLDLTVWALRRRSKNIIDSWDGIQYTRVFAFNEHPVKVNVEQGVNQSQIKVTASSLHSIPAIQDILSTFLKRMLGLEINLEPFYQLGKKDKSLKSLVLHFKGMKPPRFPTVFEALVNAVACQQISLEAGLTLLNRLSKRYGLPFQGENQTFYAFPEARAIMHCKIHDLRALGFSQRKSEYLIELASVITLHEDRYSNLEEKSYLEIIGLLSNLKGIGRWSIEYVLLRGLGRIRIFPGDDVGAQKNLKQLLDLEEMPNYTQIQSLIRKWHPYAGLIYFHLLLQKLSEKGLVV